MKLENMIKTLEFICEASAIVGTNTTDDTLHRLAMSGFFDDAENIKEQIKKDIADYAHDSDN